VKQVIIVAPYFPPSNLAAVHRNRLFAMHLPKFGWRARILSVAPRYYEEPLDPDLEQLVPPWIEVVRTRALPTKPIRLVGDVGLRALWWHYRELGRLIRRREVDLVYISIPPNYSAILGPLVHVRYRIPYAIDYQDPWVHLWAGCDVTFSKAWWAFQFARVFEPIVLKHVRLVTGVAPGYYEGALRRSSWLDASQFVAMPLGAEESDFRFLDEYPREPRLFNPRDGNLHIIYAGVMWPQAYSTLEAVLEALRWALDHGAEHASRLRLHFVGTGSTISDASSHTVRPLAERFGLSDVVLEHPARIPYLEVLNHLKHAHAVLILGSSEAHYTASKVFQAVLSRRPVIGILHAQSTAVGVLKEANAGPVVTFDEAQPVVSRIREIAQSFIDIARDGSYSPEQVNWRAFAAYSAEAMAERLAAAFDSAVGSSGRARR
jgi:hypothetical protein